MENHRSRLAALSNLRRHSLDNCTLFAQPCLLCAGDGGSDGLCTACRADLAPLPAAHCPICADTAPAGLPCPHCRRRRPAFDTLHAPFIYAWPLNALIHAFKYGRRLDMAHALSSLFAREAPDGPVRPDLVVPVPLFAARLAERGFNQSLELARAFAVRMAAPLDDTLCVRVRNTPPQARLERAERARNVADVFVVKRAVTGLAVAIVDDVATSGATLDALAAALKKQGAHRVDAWVLARVFYSKT